MRESAERAGVRDRYLGHERFEYIDRMGGMDSIMRSDILVTDWSAMALEYAMGLEKPVLFIDLPRRIRKPERFEEKMRALRSSIVFRLGHSIPDGAAEIARLAEEKAAARSASEDE